MYMTLLEEQTHKAVQSAARKIASTEINWEQRRYEISKDIVSELAGKFDGTHTIENTCQIAIRYADILIAELKKPKDTI